MMIVYNRKAKWIQLAPRLLGPWDEFTIRGENSLHDLSYGMQGAAGSIHMSADDRFLVMSGMCHLSEASLLVSVNN
jgi:hypothetical protein